MVSWESLEEAIRNKVAQEIKSWPSKDVSSDPCRLLAKRFAKGIRINPPKKTPGIDPVYEATAGRFSTNRPRKPQDNG